jgi:hypothetical protein
MFALMRRKPPSQTINKTVPSFGAPVSRRPRSSRKATSRKQKAPHGAEPFWGVALKKFEAENLLDWLEANGRCGKLGFVPGEGFTVR